MKKIFSTQHAAATDAGLLLLRVALSALMLGHGIPKLQMLLSGGALQFPPVMGMTPEVSLLLTVLAEVACSVLIILGLGTRLAAIPGIITMLVAILLIHAADPFGKKEPAMLYLVGYLALLLAGAGRFSLDRFIRSRDRASSAGERKAAVARV